MKCGDSLSQAFRETTYRFDLGNPDVMCSRAAGISGTKSEWEFPIAKEECSPPPQLV
jgi:hypothetical protein